MISSQTARQNEYTRQSKRFQKVMSQPMERLQRWQVMRRCQEQWEMLSTKNPDPEHIPCFRVVNAKGELAGAFAFGGEQTQAKLLEEDGVEVIDGKVDLKKYGIEMI